MTLRRIALGAALAGVIPALPSSAEAAWGVGPRLGMGGFGVGLAVTASSYGYSCLYYGYGYGNPS
jgi:hypothetical protein